MNKYFIIFFRRIKEWEICLFTLFIEQLCLFVFSDRKGHKFFCQSDYYVRNKKAKKK